MNNQYYTYIMSNASGTLYTGMTNNIKNRIWQHKTKTADGFTKRYNITQLVWYYVFRTPGEAIQMEKRIKGWVREKKLDLIKSINPGWKDLSCGWFENVAVGHSEKREDS